MKTMKSIYRILLLTLVVQVVSLSVNAQFFTNNGQIIGVTPDTRVTIQGDAENLGAIFNDGTISVSGDWTNLNVYLGTDGKFILDGTSVQVVRHNNQSFYVLVIDGGGEKIIESDVDIIDSLLLVDGIVSIQDSRTLLLREDVVVLGGSDFSYINGPLSATGTGDLYFPIGTASTYAPIELIDVSGSTPVVNMEVIEPNPPATAGFGLTDVSQERYWQKSVTSGTFTDSQVKLAVKNETIVDNMIKAVVAEANTVGGEFTSIGQISFTGDATDGTITSDTRSNSDIFAVGLELNEDRVADSLALVAFYQLLDGANWDNSDNWLDGTSPISSWFGITVVNDRVTQINLADNNLVGEISNQIKKLTECTILNLSNNQIIGSVPDQIIQMSGLQTLNLANNDLTYLPDLTALTTLVALDVTDNQLLFNSLAPNIPIGSGFSYIPQDSIGDPLVTLKLDVGQPFELSVSTVRQDNNYQWVRDGSPIAGATDSIYSESSIGRDNMGVFYCEITNPNVPGLTLYNHTRGVFAKADIEGEVLISDTEFLTSGSIKLLQVGSGSYDTIVDQPLVASGAYIFDDIILGDYVIIAEPFDGSEYLPTYFYNEIQWDEADVLVLNKDTAGVDILMVGPPPELTDDDGNGLFDGFVEEDITEEGGRLEAGRRVKRAGVLLKRRPPDSRPEADDDGFEIIAYTQTDDNGEFTIDNLPPGTYRIFIEYPGVPMDTTTFVEFELGLDLDQNSISISAIVTEDGIQVELLKETGVPYDYIDALNIYPNPAVDRIYVDISARRDYEIDLEILDMRGVSMLRRNIKGYTISNGRLELDVANLVEGMYFVKITVPEYNNMLYRVGKLTIKRR